MRLMLRNFVGVEAQKRTSGGKSGRALATAVVDVIPDRE
jgi:hypothetical protein